MNVLTLGTLIIFGIIFVSCWYFDSIYPIKLSINIIRYVVEDKVLEIEVELGMRDGHEYPFIGEGQH